MRKYLLCFAALVAISFGAAAAQAADTLVYSMEGAPPPSGFGPNGGGITVTQSTTGVTQGTNSMKMSVVPGATFVGALTGNVPAALGNPPGVDHVLFDMTIGDGEAFAGAFSVLGVTIFGASQPDYPGGQQFGLQAQFADFVHIDGKAAGTYKDIRLNLTSATNPLNFATGQSFNQLFGNVGDGQNVLIPTGFQFFLNKSNDASSVVYIDNVRVGGVPEPASCTLLGLGAIGLLALARRRFR